MTLVLRKRLAKALLKMARRLDPPPRIPRFTGRVNEDISAAIILSEERLAEALRAHQRRQWEGGQAR